MTCIKNISTHAPRTGSDDVVILEDCDTQKFQPTLPARGATMMTRRPA